jgi:hypothetical protein
MGAYGWDAKTADGTVITNVDETPAGDILLTEVFKATFNAYNSDDTLASEQIIYFSEFTHTLADVNSADFAPAMPALEHYTFAWDAYTVSDYANFTVKGKYTPVTYTVTFVADGNVIDEIEYTIENFFFLYHIVVLYLEVIITIAEHVFVPLGSRFCFVIIAL